MKIPENTIKVIHYPLKYPTPEIWYCTLSDGKCKKEKTGAIHREVFKIVVVTNNKERDYIWACYDCFRRWLAKQGELLDRFEGK